MLVKFLSKKVLKAVGEGWLTPEDARLLALLFWHSKY
jgi:hypothetical protein